MHKKPSTKKKWKKNSIVSLERHLKNNSSKWVTCINDILTEERKFTYKSVIEKDGLIRILQEVLRGKVVLSSSDKQK